MEIKQITVTLNGIPHTCPAGTFLGNLMQSHGHGHMPCGGHGKCGKCRVTVTGAVEYIVGVTFVPSVQMTSVSQEIGFVTRMLMSR